MIISTSHKFVYCAVPKVASRTLRSLFEPLADLDLMGRIFKTSHSPHGSLAFHKPVGVRDRLVDCGFDPSEFFWFGVMRNPWDRAVSRYFFERERSKKKGVLDTISKRHAEYHQRMIGLSWEDYLLKAPYFPQTDWLKDAQGVAVDRIYRMEDLETVLQELGEVLGCTFEKPGVRGATIRDRDYRTYFENERQVEAVARYYAEDILLGGYRFDGSYGESFDLKRLVARPG